MTVASPRSWTVAAVAVAAAILPAAPAQAAGVTGCPPAYEVMSVAPLQALGYQVPAAVDSPTSGIRSFGHAGNGNGSVCALPLGNQTWGDGLQIYNFLDDTLRS